MNFGIGTHVQVRKTGYFGDVTKICPKYIYVQLDGSNKIVRFFQSSLVSLW